MAFFETHPYRYWSNKLTDVYQTNYSTSTKDLTQNSIKKLLNSNNPYISQKSFTKSHTYQALESDWNCKQYERVKKLSYIKKRHHPQSSYCSLKLKQPKNKQKQNNKKLIQSQKVIRQIVHHHHYHTQYIPVVKKQILSSSHHQFRNQYIENRNLLNKTSQIQFRYVSPPAISNHNTFSEGINRQSIQIKDQIQIRQVQNSNLIQIPTIKISPPIEPYDTLSQENVKVNKINLFEISRNTISNKSNKLTEVIKDNSLPVVEESLFESNRSVKKNILSVSKVQ